MSESDFLDQLRRESLLRLADLCSTRAKPGSFFSGPQASCEPDLLFTLTKLHASHLNNLAAFGISQANHARRLLELLYCGYAGGNAPFGAADSVSGELEFRGKLRSSPSRKIVVQNRTDKADVKVTLRWSRFQPLGGGQEFSVEPTHVVAPKVLGAHGEGIVEATIPLKERFASGKSYVAVLEVDVDATPYSRMAVLVVVE